jgi:L-lactate dehydrogenase complex protein LldG
LSERENILERVKEALRNEAHPPHPSESQRAGAHPVSSAIHSPRAWLPVVGESLAERLEMFTRNATNLKAAFVQVSALENVREQLQQLQAAEGWKTVASHHGTLTDSVCTQFGCPVRYVDSGYEPSALDVCDAGITECDALVAQTGSVLLTSRSAGGRALSVLPPHHVVLARIDQLVRDLPDAFALLRSRYGADYPSFISFVTGPSRTGDIERILVLGAHGPKRLTIFCVGA